MNHPIFAEFPAREVAVPPGHVTDFIGTLTRAAHMQRNQAAPGGKQTPGLPAIDEEYFEWIDILESATRAKSTYTMLELGAGYGRWASRAYAAARRRGLAKIMIGLIEAEPAHVAWIPEHMGDNQVTPKDFKVHDLALSNHETAGWFYVAMPPGYDSNSAKEWYGQALTNDPHQVLCQWEFGRHEGESKIAELEALIPAELRHYYLGHTFALLPGGWMAMRVKQAPLSSVLRSYEFIDLVDADIQGEELNAFPEAINEMNSRVARVHIGTHSEQCEARLREVFSAAGWKPVWDFSCLKTHSTPFGSVYFNDGVQTWINPRFDR